MTDTRFQPGVKPPVRRARGAQNKITRDIKNGIVTAAINLGRDGKGAGGLIGYFEWLGRKKPMAFAHLLGKLVPLKLDGELAVGLTQQIRIVAVPSGHFLTQDQISGREPLPEGEVVTPPPPVIEPLPVFDEPPSAELVAFPTTRRENK